MTVGLDKGDGDRPVVAAVDVGTNSVHMVVARLALEGGFEVLTRHKESVRLGESASEIKELSEDGIERAVQALRRCADIAAAWDAEVRAVATSAVREAGNRDAFLLRARAEAGMDVDVISGLEEARLIHLGVLAAVPLYDRTIMVCDIGGGSTELLVGRGPQVVTSRSFKLGAIRLTRRFFPDGVVRSGALDAARRYVRETVLPYALEVVGHGVDSMVGSSGTIECMVRMALAERATESGRSPDDARAAPAQRNLGGIEVSSTEISAVTKRLGAAAEPADRSALAGIDPARVDIIVGGAVILEQVMETFAIKSLVYSDYALREGVLLDVWRRRTGRMLHHLSDIRRSGVERLMRIGDEDVDHSRRVAALSLELFEAFAPALELPDESAELLEAAALLCNVGIVVNHSRHHLHSYYVIRNAEQLVGFTDAEIEVIAQVARYHRKSAPTQRHREFASMDDDRQRLVRALAALLRVAVGLDRSHRGAVTGLQVDLDDEVARIGAWSGGPAGVDTEVHAAQQRSALLGEVLGRPVEVVAVSATSSP